MIIDRITAVRAVPPRLATKSVPTGSREIATASVVGSGELQIAEGPMGTLLDVSYDEIEIELYTRRDIALASQPSQILTV